MRIIGIIGVLALGVGLGGCASNGDGGHLDLGEDGVRCGLPAIGGRVHIEIRYAGDGTPSAVPEDCTVAPGTRITWRGPDKAPTPFLLRFTEASPAGRGEPRELPSRETADRQRIVIIAGNGKGRYKYDIEANGITVDPAIIIDR